jgi:putative glutathione S-transferase
VTRSELTDRRPYVPAPDDDRPGSFVRQPYVFRDWVTSDGSSGYRAEPGRYHLYISWACPWAQRSAIVRALKGLEDVVGLTVVDPVRDERGWAFTLEPDPVNGFSFLREAYAATDAAYHLSPTVPVLWDKQTNRIVSNNFHDITIMLSTEFEDHADTSIDLYPVALREEIDATNEVVYRDVNDGVYRCGFARTQAAYEEAFDRLFSRLDELDERLSRERFLVGERLTEADVRLFTTLVRFDAVYYVHFKCNKRRLVDYTNLWRYARDLYRRPAFRDTTNFDHIKRHYYLTHPALNPRGIVPKGPDADWDAPLRRR